jgi:hypothetical protein
MIDTYTSTDFCCSIPDSDDFDIPSYQYFALTLLPVEDHAYVFGARKKICQPSESRHQLDLIFELVVPKNFDYSIG